jgi:hypothetical protein
MSNYNRRGPLSPPREQGEDTEMMRKKILRRMLWLGRGTATVMGLAVMLAVVLGVATTALGAVPGDPFKLGRINTIDRLSILVGSVNNPMLKIDNDSTGANATALDLEVEPGKAPMKVDSRTKVANLNSDRLDGKSADQIGVNGLEQVTFAGPDNSDSRKSRFASCPAGKVLVGTGYNIIGGESGSVLNEETDVVIDSIIPTDTSVTVEAFEEEPTDANWSLFVTVICATAP